MMKCVRNRVSQRSEIPILIFLGRSTVSKDWTCKNSRKAGFCRMMYFRYRKSTFNPWDIPAVTVTPIAMLEADPPRSPPSTQFRTLSVRVYPLLPIFFRLASDKFAIGEDHRQLVVDGVYFWELYFIVSRRGPTGTQPL